MKNAGVWMGIVLFVFSGLICKLSLSYGYYDRYGPGPGLFPLWISGMLLILSVLYVLESIKVKEDIVLLSDVFPKGRDLTYIVTMVAAIVLFIAVISFTGYLVAGMIMTFILYQRNYKWYKALVLSAVTTGSLFLVFQVFLKVPLPVNAFGW